MSTALSAFLFFVVASNAGAVDVPWGKGETLGEKIALEATTVCADSKSHYVVLAPNSQILYGNGSTFVEVRRHSPDAPSDAFFDPRHFNPKNNSNFFGIDTRFYSQVKVETKDGAKTCELSCGERTRPLKVLEPTQVKELLVKAKFEENPQQYLPMALLRDALGNYYLVERGLRPGMEKSFRLWIGPKGRLLQQRMVNVVTDSEGDIFSTKNGELRLILDRAQPSVWIRGNQKTTLRRVPVEENWGLIYNELGVYRGARLGTPCDDL